MGRSLSPFFNFKIAVLANTVLKMNSKCGSAKRQTMCKLDNVFPTLSISYIPVVVRFSFIFAFLAMDGLMP